MLYYLLHLHSNFWERGLKDERKIDVSYNPGHPRHLRSI